MLPRQLGRGRYRSFTIPSLSSTIWPGTVNRDHRWDADQTATGNLIRRAAIMPDRNCRLSRDFTDLRNHVLFGHTRYRATERRTFRRRDADRPAGTLAYQLGGTALSDRCDWSQSGVPEASTWAMMALGFAGLGLLAYRKRADARRRLTLKGPLQVREKPPSGRLFSCALVGRYGERAASTTRRTASTTASGRSIWI